MLLIEIYAIFFRLGLLLEWVVLGKVDFLGSLFRGPDQKGTGTFTAKHRRPFWEKAPVPFLGVPLKTSFSNRGKTKQCYFMSAN